ncbi:MAG: hypothetical protein GX969_04860 [Firmicutes bacterium]|nr:hypothetical protein [Bacillota bacterium]
MSLASAMNYAVILSFIILFEMVWVIAINQCKGIPGKMMSFAIFIVVGTIAVYVFFVSVIAVKVMTSLFYRL